MTISEIKKAIKEDKKVLIGKMRKQIVEIKSEKKIIHLKTIAGYWIDINSDDIHGIWIED